MKCLRPPHWACSIRRKTKLKLFLKCFFSTRWNAFILCSQASFPFYFPLHRAQSGDPFTRLGADNHCEIEMIWSIHATH